MYNETLKKRYLETRNEGNPITHILTHPFEKSAATEEKLGKDLCNFNEEEIMNLYKHYNSRSWDTLRVLNSIYAMYTQYTIEKGFSNDCINHYNNISTEELLVQCVNKNNFRKGIITRDQLRKIASEMINPYEAFMVYALFEGIRGKECSDLYSLTMDNFNGDYVNLPSGKRFKVTKELLKYAKEASEETLYYVHSENGYGGTKPFKHGDNKIFKDKWNSYTDSKAMKHRRIAVMLKTIVKIYELDGVTSGTLLESGRIDMVKHFMEEDHNDDLMSTIKKHRDEIGYRYGEIRSFTMYVKKYGEFYK